jgi:hypothetical protein
VLRGGGEGTDGLCGARQQGNKKRRKEDEEEGRCFACREKMESSGLSFPQQRKKLVDRFKFLLESIFFLCEGILSHDNSKRRISMNPGIIVHKHYTINVTGISK